MKKSKSFTSTLLKICLMVTIVTFLSSANIFAKCKIKNTIQIAEMNWESAGIMAHIVNTILSEGYGCKTQLVPGSTVPTGSTILSKGKPHVAPELWVGSLTEVWGKIKKKKKFYAANSSFESAGEGWWIPKYVQDENPGLKSVEDLKDYAHLFEEPGSRGKGRLYGCPPGWACEIITANLHKALGLEDSFELFSPGDQGALDAALSRRVKQKKAVVGYYWEPTTLVARLGLVRLDMPKHNKKKWSCLTDSECQNPQVTGWTPSEVLVVVAKTLNKDRNVKKFFSKFSIPNSTLYETLSWLHENSGSYEDASTHYLQTHKSTWKKWVSKSAARKIEKSL